MKYKPFIRWVGGKTRNLKVLDPLLPDLDDISYYYEPFLGGGAMFFHILNKNLRMEYRLSDSNKELINLWSFFCTDFWATKLAFKKLSVEYNGLETKEGRNKFYIEARARFNEIKSTELNWIERSALMLFLSKTSFNGMYRENSKGGFNVPMGDREFLHDPFFDEHFKSLKIKVKCKSFNEQSLQLPKRSFFFMDPPFYVGDESKFTSYNKEGFGVVQQMELAVHFRKLDAAGAKIMLCNSANGDGFLESLYKGFDIQYYDINRGLTSACVGGEGGKNKEMVIRNYV